MKDKLFKILVLGCLGIIAADAVLDLKMALGDRRDECDGCCGFGMEDSDDFEDDLDEPDDGSAGKD